MGQTVAGRMCRAMPMRHGLGLTRARKHCCRKHIRAKIGSTPKAWKQNPAKNRQKDKDARWTKKPGLFNALYMKRSEASASGPPMAMR